MENNTGCALSLAAAAALVMTAAVVFAGIFGKKSSLRDEF